jgi:hypothetical protein
MNTKLRILKNSFKEEWKSWNFKLLLIASILLVFNLIFYFKYSYLFIGSFTLWIIAYFSYEIVGEKWQKKDKFQKLYSFYILILNLAFLAIYIIFLFKLTVLTLAVFLGVIFYLFIVNFVYSLILLWQSKRDKLLFVISTYLFMAFMTIVLFGFIFSFTSAFEGNKIINPSSNEPAKVAWEYVYFSSGTFYSASFGDYVPIGIVNKVISQIELALSAIIHIIILGEILSKRNE